MLVPDRLTFKILVVIGTFVHYALAFLYSKKQIAGLFSQKSTLVGLGVIAALIYSCYVGHIWLLTFVFGFHLVFNEVYLLHRSTLKPTFERTRALRVWSSIFCLFLYTIAVRHMLGWVGENMMVVCAGATICGVIYAWTLSKSLALFTRTNIIDAIGLELMGLTAVALSFFAPIGIFEVVLYHITFWGIYPLLKMQAQPKLIAAYLLQNVAGFLIALQLTPLGWLAWHFSVPQLMDQFRLWSFIHIFTSLAISNAHPGWLVRLFQPRGAFLSLAQAPELLPQAVHGQAGVSR
jgi:hypothetical protein